MSASRVERFRFDPFQLWVDGFVMPQATLGACDIVQAHVAVPMIVIVDESTDQVFGSAGQDVVFWKAAVLPGRMPAIDIALRPRVLPA